MEILFSLYLHVQVPPMGNLVFSKIQAYGVPGITRALAPPYGVPGGGGQVHFLWLCVIVGFGQ